MHLSGKRRPSPDSKSRYIPIFYPPLLNGKRKIRSQDLTSCSGSKQFHSSYIYHRLSFAYIMAPSCHYTRGIKYHSCKHFSSIYKKKKADHTDPQSSTLIPIFLIKSPRDLSYCAWEIAPCSRNRSSVCFWLLKSSFSALLCYFLLLVIIIRKYRIYV